MLLLPQTAAGAAWGCGPPRASLQLQGQSLAQQCGADRQHVLGKPGKRQWTPRCWQQQPLLKRLCCSASSDPTRLHRP